MALSEWLVKQLLLADLRSAGVPPEIGAIGRAYMEGESYRRFIADEDRRITKAADFAERYATSHPETFPETAKATKAGPRCQTLPLPTQIVSHRCVELDDEFDEDEEELKAE